MRIVSGEWIKSKETSKDDKFTVQGELFPSCSELASKAAIHTDLEKVHPACHCDKYRCGRGA